LDFALPFLTPAEGEVADARLLPRDRGAAGDASDSVSESSSIVMTVALLQTPVVLDKAVVEDEDTCAAAVADEEDVEEATTAAAAEESDEAFLSPKAVGEVLTEVGASGENK
jgi:hypothetical protein